jgi:NAD(P)-dependent dehydrogenase (short-subunit alcohol dehydrogenase family)/uncharacterized OB-fold protein
MSGTNLDFHDRSALVTGAGAGLGRAHARLLASRGAAVVVNDLGTAVDGSGSSPSGAAAVVEEIRAAGGIAVADHHSVATPEGAEAMVQAALDEFDRLDIVVNSAGILRDATIVNATPESVDAVLDVHLKGAFNVVRSAWPHMTARQHGRIVNTSSNSGILGNFGQSNYAAAKMGLVGLTKVLALEGAKHGIRANAVAPMARTRMTEGLVADEADRLAPGLVSPVVAWLAHDSCSLSGETLSAGGGQVARFFVGLTRGWSRRGGLTVEDVDEHICEICDTERFWEPSAGIEEVKALLGSLRAAEPPAGPPGERDMTGSVPIVSYLELDGVPRLVANECAACGALHLDQRERCGRCGDSRLSKRHLATTGTIRTFTVVHRSAPGVEVPFTSTVVDLDGGGTVRGNLLDPLPDPSAITYGDRVRVVERVVGVDVDGTEAVAFAFAPEAR